MKLIKLTYATVLMALMMVFTSCESFFQDVNLDPVNPTDVKAKVLLSSIEGRLAYVIGGDASRYIGIYTRHIDGAGRQFAVIQEYGIQPSDVNTMWGTNLYAGVMADIRLMQDIATADGLTYYQGVSKVLEAYTMLFITDTWGDAPYAEAIQGTDVIQPKFDSQADIYTAIFTLLSDARTDLGAADGGLEVPGTDDFIYGGNIDSWIKFSYFVEARANLHWSKTGGASSLQAAITAANNSFTSSADDAAFPFSSAPTETAPWYQYNEQRRDIVIGSTYTALMASLNDPRDTLYGATLDNDHPLLIRARALPLGSYEELQFILAEAYLQTGQADEAYVAYLNAINADFDDLEAQAAGTISADERTAYLAQTDVDPGAATSLTLSQIMTQKYIASFMDPEVFVDWRRTGIPTLTPNTGTVVPRRLPYPEQEILFNSNTPTDLTIFDRVGWDVN